MNRDDAEGRRIAEALKADIQQRQERPMTLELIGPNGRAPIPGPQIAAPLNDLQLVALMAAVLARPDGSEGPGAETWAHLAVSQALTLLGHACHAQGMGSIGATIGTAIQHGQAAARMAADLAERQQRGEE